MITFQWARFLVALTIFQSHNDLSKVHQAPWLYLWSYMWVLQCMYCTCLVLVSHAASLYSASTSKHHTLGINCFSHVHLNRENFYKHVIIWHGIYPGSGIRLCPHKEVNPAFPGQRVSLERLQFSTYYCRGHACMPRHHWTKWWWADMDQVLRYHADMDPIMAYYTVLWMHFEGPFLK